jgi:hypothetical protein
MLPANPRYLDVILNETEVAVVNNKLCEGIPFESRGWALSIVGLVCAPVAIVAVFLRCYARIAVARQFGWDDFITVVAAAFLAALVVLDLYSKAPISLRWNKD